MKEIVIQHFVEGHASARELAKDTEGAFDRQVGSAEINYPLTPIVLGKIRHYLLTGDNTLTRDDIPKDGKPRPPMTTHEIDWQRP